MDRLAKLYAKSNNLVTHELKDGHTRNCLNSLHPYVEFHFKYGDGTEKNIQLDADEFFHWLGSLIYQALYD